MIDLNPTVHYYIRNKDGWTVLTAAAQGGHVSVVKLLLEAKADVNQANMVRDTFFSCQVI